jgi:hypothetical protein
VFRTNMKAGEQVAAGDVIVTFLGRHEGQCRFTVEVGGHVASHATKGAERIDILPGIFFIVERRAEMKQGWRGGGGERVRLSLEAPSAVMVRKLPKKSCQVESRTCNLEASASRAQECPCGTTIPHGTL